MARDGANGTRYAIAGLVTQLQRFRERIARSVGPTREPAHRAAERAFAALRLADHLADLAEALEQQLAREHLQRDRGRSTDQHRRAHGRGQ